jgi:hypothetical protein
LYKQALMYFDKAIDYTYVAVRVDIAFTLVRPPPPQTQPFSSSPSSPPPLPPAISSSTPRQVAIYRGRQRASEGIIRNSMNTISDHLRNTSTFARLRPK